MTTTTKVKWAGKSGKTYEFLVYPIDDDNWNDVPGNYIFAKSVNGKWTPIYIGESESLKDRLNPSHEKWPCVIRHSGTHIHAHINQGGKVARRTEEADLVANYNPVCNG